MTIRKIFISYLICYIFCLVIAQKNKQTCFSRHSNNIKSLRHYASKTAYPINDYNVNLLNHSIAGKVQCLAINISC